MNNDISGKIIEGSYKSIKYKPGTVFKYSLHIPDKCFSLCHNAILVNHDGLNVSEVKAMETLANAGKAPYIITLGVAPGILPATASGGFDRGMRMDEYDMFDSAYPDFVVNELIPFIQKEYSLQLSSSPDMHMVSGGSSGGISAFNMAFIRNDYFHRVYMSSPSFLSMGKGNELPILVRKCEPKPIKIYLEYSGIEPNDYFGSSLCAAREIETALEFAGYSFKCRVYPEEGHCSRYMFNNTETLLEGFSYLWENYTTEPVTVKKLSERCKNVISIQSKWEKADKVPEKRENTTNKGKYIIEDNHIVFISETGKSVVADGFRCLCAIALSSDQWRLYASDRDRGCVYAYTICADGSLCGKYLHGALHLLTDFEYPGAFDLCVDCFDRVFAATELGIQTIRSFGLIDVILTLPEKETPLSVSLVGDELYVHTEKNNYRRKINSSERTYEITAPKAADYYD